MTRRRFGELALLCAVFFGGVSTIDAGTLPARPAITRKLRKWQCTNQDCDPYIYDPSLGDVNAIDEDHPIPPGVAFQELSDEWICHVCGDPKRFFIPLDEWVIVKISA